MSNAVMASGQILQVGSQQRSWKQFHRACELVRNGRIGEVKHVEIGLPGDPAGGDTKPMPIPAGVDYESWGGAAPEKPPTGGPGMPPEGVGPPGERQVGGSG